MSKVRLCLALIVAGLFSPINKVATWRRFWRALQALFGSPKPVTEQELLRVHTCKSCPVFYCGLRGLLQTCGSPLSNPEIGCWCDVKAKASDPKSECWLDEELGDEAPYGWHKVIK